MHDYRVSSDTRSVANFDGADYLGSRRDKHAVSQNRSAIPIRAKCNLMIQVYVRSAADFAVDDNAH